MPLEGRFRRTAVTRCAIEGNASAIGRPAGLQVVRCRWQQVLDGRLRVAIDTDEAVVPAVGNERESSAVRRPAQLGILAVVEEQALRRPAAVEGSGPYAVIRPVNVGDCASVR